MNSPLVRVLYVFLILVNLYFAVTNFQRGNTSNGWFSLGLALLWLVIAVNAMRRGR